MLQRSKFSSKLLIGLASLGFIGAIAAYSTPGQAQTSSSYQTPSYAPRANDDSATRMGVEPSSTERTEEANYTSPERPRNSEEMMRNSRASRSNSQVSSDSSPVNNTTPGGNERESAARTPATDPGELNNGMSGSSSTGTTGSFSSSGASSSNVPANAGSTTGNRVEPSATERTPEASRTSPERSGSMDSSMNSGSSMNGGSSTGVNSSPSTLDEPVNDTRPGGNERQSAPRTPLTDPGELNNGNGAGTTPGAQSRGDANQSFTQAFSNNAEFSTLATALRAAGLDTTLASGGPYTIFAPTNEAFAAIPPETLRQLLLPENRQVLRQILAYHVVQGDLPSDAIKSGPVSTVEGSPVAISTNAGSVTVSGANVVEPDIVTRNGVIHGIDQVLLPPTLQR